MSWTRKTTVTEVGRRASWRIAHIHRAQSPSGGGTVVMVRLWLLPVVLTISCAVVVRVDLGEYLNRPPGDRPLVERSEFLAAYGEGCVRLEENAPGAPRRELHAYFDPSSGHWVEATVLIGGPTSETLVGVLVTDVPLCAEEVALPEILTTVPCHRVRASSEG